VIHGYQEFAIRDRQGLPIALDAPLQRKARLAKPYFNPEFMAGRTLLDVGANGGFFCFWARRVGAGRAVALEMDEAYTDLIRKAQAHLGRNEVETANGRVQDWEHPSDVVLAFAMVHWLYACTANYGSLDAVIAKLAGLTRELLLVEWVSPDDPAIASFGHLEWNPDLDKGPYTRDAFESALQARFHKVEALGATSPTRSLYAAFKHGNEITISAALPLLAPADRVISSRRLISIDGIPSYSRVYSGVSPGRIIKQASGDLAAHEGAILETLESPHFPRVFAREQRDRYSVIELERIEGPDLASAIPSVAATPRSLAAFMRECLKVLGTEIHHGETLKARERKAA